MGKEVMDGTGLRTGRHRLFIISILNLGVFIGLGRTLWFSEQALHVGGYIKPNRRKIIIGGTCQ